GLLFTVKYFDFTATALDNLFALLGIGARLPRLGLLLPLGLSFYIFQSVGYMLDVYRKKIKPDRNPLRLALFVSFFPQVIQGPIGRHGRLSETLYKPHRFDADQMKYGIQLMLWGAFKKMVIADRAAVLVDTVFSKYTSYGGALIFVGVIFYCLQIYCDFSGGIDMARGVAQCLGIRMDENFRRPYFAGSVSEFWQRWHITLGSWMRDYLFYPIALSKPFAKLGKTLRRKWGRDAGKIVPASLATFVVFFVIGIWHGASFKFVAFGLYNGVIITASTLLEKRYARIKKRLGIAPGNRKWRVFAILRTFLLLCVGRYFSRAATLMTSLRMMERTVTVPKFFQLADGTLLNLGLDVTDLIVLALSAALLFAVSFRQERGVEIRRSLEKRNFLTQWAVMVAAIVIILFFGIYRDSYVAQQFIYAGF
ncbi:MAG: MBOAT family protein, partial [Oscillospiraceae bacterium]|nr:MBOAT family protein [Oscillospiraceae bacterium]